MEFKKGDIVIMIVGYGTDMPPGKYLRRLPHDQEYYQKLMDTGIINIETASIEEKEIWYRASEEFGKNPILTL